MACPPAPPRSTPPAWRRVDPGQRSGATESRSPPAPVANCQWPMPHCQSSPQEDETVIHRVLKQRVVIPEGCFPVPAGRRSDRSAAFEVKKFGFANAAWQMRFTGFLWIASGIADFTAGDKGQARRNRPEGRAHLGCRPPFLRPAETRRRIRLAPASRQPGAVAPRQPVAERRFHPQGSARCVRR